MRLDRADKIYIVIATVLAALAVTTYFIGPEGLSGLIVGQTEGDYRVLVRIDNGEKVTENSPYIARGETAFDALKRVADVDYKIFVDGAALIGVNGVSNDKKHYWLCLVEGELPETGCDYYHPAEGEVITFRYLSVSEAAEYF